MSERPTPETDAEHQQFAMGGFTLDFCRKLERERDKAAEDATNYYARIGELEKERDEANESSEAFSALAWKLEGERNELRDKMADALQEVDLRTLDYLRMREAIIATLEENRHLADGDDCTLAKLKSVVPNWR